MLIIVMKLITSFTNINPMVFNKRIDEKFIKTRIENILAVTFGSKSKENRFNYHYQSFSAMLS